MPFFSKLSQKQIIGLFAGLFVIFVISILTFVQLTGNQKSSQQNNSSANSDKSVSFSSSNSSTNSNSNYSNNSNSVANSGNLSNQSSNFINNSNNSSNSNSTSSENQNPTKSINSSNKNGENGNSNQNLYFKGKIGDKNIRVIFEVNIGFADKRLQETGIVPSIVYAEGKYIYEGISKSVIDLNCEFYLGGLNINTCTEIVDNKKTGFWYFGGNDKTGFWNQQFVSNTEKEPNSVKIELVKIEPFKIEDFLVKSGSLTNLKKNNISVEDRKLWYQKLKWTQSCEDNSSDFEILGDTSGQMKFLNLSDTEFLVNIKCNCGAYQCWNNLVYYDEKNDISKLLEFDSYKENGDKTKTNLLTSLGFDLITKKLESFNKYAGHGGCGYKGNYKWNDTLKSFELTDFKQNSDCNNIDKMKNWKIIYQK